jgi:hypothetical protein
LDDGYFTQKNKDTIIAEINALQKRRLIIPIKKHNLRDMPYGESKIVCRDAEISMIKAFIYGSPDDIRKRLLAVFMVMAELGKPHLYLRLQNKLFRISLIIVPLMIITLSTYYSFQPKRGN